MQQNTMIKLLSVLRTLTMLSTTVGFISSTPWSRRIGTPVAKGCRIVCKLWTCSSHMIQFGTKVAYINLSYIDLQFLSVYGTCSIWSIPGSKHNYTCCLNICLWKSVLTFLGRQNAVHYKFNNLTPHHKFSYSLITQVLLPHITGRENQVAVGQVRLYVQIAQTEWEGIRTTIYSNSVVFSVQTRTRIQSVRFW